MIRWRSVESPAEFVRAIIGAESPSVEPIVVGFEQWDQVVMELEDLDVDVGMVDRHDRSGDTTLAEIAFCGGLRNPGSYRPLSPSRPLQGDTSWLTGTHVFVP